MADISHQDMIDYVVGDAQLEVAQKIWEQSQQPGTFAYRWMENLTTAASDPFDISMVRLLSVDVEADRSSSISEESDDIPLFLKILTSICIVSSAILGITVGWFSGWIAGLVAGMIAYLVCALLIGILGVAFQERKEPLTRDDVIGGD